MLKRFSATKKNFFFLTKGYTTTSVQGFTTPTSVMVQTRTVSRRRQLQHSRLSFAKTTFPPASTTVYTEPNSTLVSVQQHDWLDVYSSLAK